MMFSVDAPFDVRICCENWENDVNAQHQMRSIQTGRNRIYIWMNKQNKEKDGNNLLVGIFCIEMKLQFQLEMHSISIMQVMPTVFFQFYLRHLH